jgi:hypothetical protein
MSRIRTPLLLCVALLTSASALAGGVPELRVGPITVSGIYSLTFNLRIASTLPAGTTIICRARIVPGQGEFDLRNQPLPAIPLGMTTGLASLTGSTATCAEEIPFSWTVLNARGGVVLSYEIDALSNSGSIPLLVKSSGLQNVGAAFPAPGGRASLSFNLTF